MLYTFSQANYATAELQGYFDHMSAEDAVVLWQDGVLLAIKYPELFTHCPAFCAILENDISARNLTALLPPKSPLKRISFAQLVDITETQKNQLAL